METYTIEIEQLSVEYQAIFSAFEPNWLILENVSTTDLPNGKTEIQGKSKSDWIDHTVGLELTNIEIILVQSADNSNLEIEQISAQQPTKGKPNIWIADNSGIGTLIFKSQNLIEKPLKRNEAENLPFFNGLDTLMNLVEFEEFTYELHLSALPDLRIIYQWSSAVEMPQKLTVGDSFFSINELVLNGAVFELNAATTSQIISRKQRAQLSAYVSLGLEKELTAELLFALDNNPYYTFQISPQNGDLFSSFTALLKALGLTNFEALADAFNKDINILKKFEFKRVLIHADKQNLSNIHRVSLFGRITAFNTLFDIILNYSDGVFNLDLRMKNDQSLELSTLLGEILGEDLHLPSSPSIHAFQLKGGIDPLNYRFFVRLTDLWSIKIGGANSDNRIDLNVISIRISRNSIGEFAFELGASLIILGIDMELSAMRQPNSVESGWLLETKIAHEKSMSLPELIAELGESFHFTPPENIPDIAISEIDLSFHTVLHNFQFHITAELKSTMGPFTGGKINLSIDLNKSEAGHHDLNMNLEGFVAIHEVEVDFMAQNIGQKNWTASVVYNVERHEGMLTLENFCQHFDATFEIENKELASLALKHFEIDYAQSANGDHTLYTDLELTTKDGTSIEGFFSGQHANNKWNIAAGLGYVDSIHDTDEGQPDIIKKLPTSSLHLQSIWLIFINANGVLPRLPDHIPDAVKLDEVTTGIALVAELDITQHHTIPGAKVISDKGHSKLNVLVELTKKKLHIEASLGGKIRFPTKKLLADATAEEIRNAEFVIDAPSLIFEVTSSSISLAIKGSFTLHLDGFKQNLSVELVLSSSGIYLLADLKFSGDGWMPFGLEGMHIDELALELGIEFTPPGGIVGFMGGAHFDSNESDKLDKIEGGKKSENEFAIVLEFVGIVPNLEYFALKIKAFNLADILALFPGSSAHGHTSISRNVFSINNFELAWCESPIILPNGQQGHVGLGCHGTATIFGWKAYASLEVHPDTGIQGDGVLSPLNIGPLSITGDSEGKFLEQESVEGKVQVISNTQIQSPQPEGNNPDVILDGIDTLEIIPKGGACVHFNSNGSPYLNLSVNVKVLKVDVLKLHIEVTKDKLEFDLHLNIVILSIRGHCAITNGAKQTFEINGSLFFGIGLHLEFKFLFTTVTIDIELGIKAEMNLSYNGDYINLGLAGSISFFGFEIDLGSFELDHIPTDLKKLPAWLKSYVKNSHAPEFEDDLNDASGAELPDDFGSDRWIAAEQFLAQAKEWSKFVHNDIQALVEEKSFSTERMLELIRTIHEDTEKITGEQAHPNFDDDTQELQEHLNALSLNAQAKTTDADAERMDDIDRMNWEMKWLEDADNELRNNITKEWQRGENELAEAEYRLFIAQENFINELITDSELELKLQQRDAIVATIEGHIKTLKRNDNADYPMLAIEHHNIMIKNDIRKALVVSEIEKLALKHVEQIIERSMNRQDEAPFKLTEI